MAEDINLLQKNGVVALILMSWALLGFPQDAHVQSQNVYVFSLNSLAELEDRSRSGARNSE